MTEQTNQTICGRSYTVSPPAHPQYANHRKVTIKGGAHRQTPKSRFLVEGVTHKNGQLIRFKSLENAERHIRTMKMEKD